MDDDVRALVEKGILLASPSRGFSKDDEGTGPAWEYRTELDKWLTDVSTLSDLKRNSVLLQMRGNAGKQHPPDEYFQPLREALRSVIDADGAKRLTEAIKEASTQSGELSLAANRLSKMILVVTAAVGAAGIVIPIVELWIAGSATP